ncbi:YhfC family intramembrane metalloprotease [Coriobacteriales bacterium OH1046]|nr:YhfC family intramembrane metalloprotease [Coriobacteriales bacterium OH1046]
MTGTVPTSSIVSMAVSCLIGFAIPAVLFVYFRRKKGADIFPFFIGCAVMLVFALILESAVHRVVLSSALGAAIRGNIWLYALYGGVMAGLFEETGRFIAFKTVLRNRQAKDANALMYGAGHGGFEAAALLGISMINNLAYSFMINSGNAAALTGSLPAGQLAQVEAAIQGLITAPSYQFLLGGVERIFAVMLQLSLSVLVWFAAKHRGRRHLYPLAILIHLAVDAVAVVLSGSGMPAILVEAVVGVMAILVAVYARRVWSVDADPA